MATVTEPIAEPATPGKLDRPFRISIDRYYRLIESGVIGEDEPVSLWKGRLVRTMTKHQPHNIALSKTNRVFVRMVPDGWYVAPEQPFQIGDDSLPEPDLMVVRGEPDDYPDRPPTSRDLALVVEI